MLQFLQSNIVTFIVLSVLALVVFLAIRKIVTDKKSGVGSCGCKCANCPHSCGGASADTKESDSFLR